MEPFVITTELGPVAVAPGGPTWITLGLADAGPLALEGTWWEPRGSAVVCRAADKTAQVVINGLSLLPRTEPNDGLNPSYAAWARANDIISRAVTAAFADRPAVMAELRRNLVRAENAERRLTIALMHGRIAELEAEIAANSEEVDE